MLLKKIIISVINEDLDKKIYSLESTGMFEDSQLEDLKKQRLEIKDMLYKALKS
ncbi:hypothetical protein DR79_706 [Francisella tularensis]|uniref:Uncharacterized protein n=2 Tax=Francisella tularensis TaxID=263 RepID=A0AAW3D5D3_FRATU|nr:YdcH family protein [Francisella tularensis]AJI71660.1 hypothetical protein CH69_1497 [Francisella tularensis subsp. tularensis]AKE20970.1 hypothetical protein RO31_1799 [Francisella tularensis subsp. tularensis str. SCHU S4 substr. NR-28534]EDN35088.1 conserved hypothetical protein [Francisella tularensis subsp. tularensis FSC033]EET19857.1 conserved hypothetical protein [Francisella tularensis subsp. tularensis MA00-2987]EKM85574.1 hypothetical protein B343_08742 [Francisella tularensis s